MALLMKGKISHFWPLGLGKYGGRREEKGEEEKEEEEKRRRKKEGEKKSNGMECLELLYRYVRNFGMNLCKKFCMEIVRILYGYLFRGLEYFFFFFL